MLPDFPIIKRKIYEMVMEDFREKNRQDPFLSQFREEKIFEGNRTSIKSENGEICQSEINTIMSTTYKIDNKDIIKKGHIAFLDYFQKMAEEIKGQQTKLIFREFDEAVNKTGNVVSRKGKPFTFDHFLDALEKMPIDFDENGNPFMPSIVISPEDGERIKSDFVKWDTDPEYIKRAESIINKKRDEWYDRESHRKLVD